MTATLLLTAPRMTRFSRVIVIGLDGLEPTIVDTLLSQNRLPNLASIARRGAYSRLATTTPAQTPVAWSTFATGANPGKHGIFDFLRREPSTYSLDLALNRYEQKSAFVPPRVVNLRRGTPVWQLLSNAAVPSTVLRCPCTYPPDELKGRMLSGMGVPDIRGGLGTSTFYTSEPAPLARESEQVVGLRADEGNEFRTHLVGPRNPGTRSDITSPAAFIVDATAGVVRLRSEGQPETLDLHPGVWSDWLRVRFRGGLLRVTHGMMRFLLVRLEPYLEVYASPVNFDPAAPPFPISSPWEYAQELARRTGRFYTTGMVEDHTGLTNGRFGETAFLSQCEDAMRERERMMLFELARMGKGLFFILFDTPDRVQHMFWRCREREHPANRGRESDLADYAHVIEDHYERCDAVVGRALEAVDDRTLCIVLSDHGFSSFQRGVHLNAWLFDQGYLALQPGVAPGPDAGEFLRHVDWGRTRAYALGFGSIYLNLRGREGAGIVAPDEQDETAGAIAAGLTGLIDVDRGRVAVNGARTGRDLYRGACAADSPDVVVQCAPGYRASWTTALGGVPRELFEDNTRKWGGDHIIDPALVPGVLFMNRAFAAGARMVDLAPTILSALGIPRGTEMEGRDLLS